MKSIFLLILFLIFSFYAVSQTWQQLNSEVIELFNKKEFAKAAPVAEKALAAVKKEKGENNTDYVISLYNLTTLYKELNKYDKVIPLSENLVMIAQKVLGEEHPDYVTILTNMAFFYLHEAQYQKAQALYVTIAENRKKISGDTSAEYLTALNALAIVYEKMNQYDKSESFYLQTKELRKKIFGENNQEYVVTLNNLAELYRITGQYSKAEPFYIQAEEITKKISGENDPTYLTILNNRALFYSYTGQYQKAEPLFLRVQDKRKKILGEMHPDYATTLNCLAQLYVDMGHYQKAEPLFIQASEIVRKASGEDQHSYALIINNLALLYKEMGQYQKAESLFIQAEKIDKKVLGENHPDYAIALNNLALFYSHGTQFEKAEFLYKKARDIWQKIYGVNHEYYALGLKNLGQLYASMGKYDMAEQLSIQGMELDKKILGDTHPAYTTGVNNLALLYQKMGQFEKAEALYLKNIESMKMKLGEEHPSYAVCLNNLAILYTYMNNYEKAELLYIKVKELKEKISGKNHPSYAGTINDLATVYAGWGLYEKAEALYLDSKAIREKTLGVDHPDYANSLTSLAQIYSSTGRFQNAEAYFLQAKELREKILGKNHPDYANSVSNLAGMYAFLGKYKLAEPLISEATNIKLQNLKNTFSILSEKEKGKYIDNNILLIELNNSLLYNYKTNLPALPLVNFNLQLFIKSVSLSDTRSMLESIKAQDSSSQKIYKEWQENKSILAKQYSLPANKQIQKLDSIETRSEILEKELTRRSSNFRSRQSAINISMQDVRKNMQQDEAAIEFVRFRLYNMGWRDSILYAAYVLRKNDSMPVFVALCEEKQLQSLFFSENKNTATLVNKFYRGASTDENASVFKGDSLYKLIWQPLEPYLSGIKKISYSPAGKLYTIAFNALPVDDNKLLMDKYQLRQYTSTRQIALRSTSAKTNNPTGIALFGDAAFSLDSVTLVKNKKISPVNQTSSAYIPLSRGNTILPWSDLPGTAEEIKKIQKLFSENKIIVSTFTRQRSSEENLKSLSGKAPEIVHIATHGFFLPDPNKDRERLPGASNTYSSADDPLLRSGLILAGGNYRWSGKAAIDDVEDGIVTAYEISQLDLSKTSLVVLSACETALGDVKGSEGVFGLQRAFKMAGVNKLIVSLWQVPDKETAELMTVFYSKWLSGKTVEESFYIAQAEMRKKYAPFYWAAFVLVE